MAVWKRTERGGPVRDGTCAQPCLEPLEPRLLLNAAIALDASNGFKHTFIDDDGDQVTVALKDCTAGELVLAAGTEGDPVSLRAVSAGANAAISINVKKGQGTGETTIQRIDLDGAFKSVSAKKVLLVADGIHSVGAVASYIAKLELEHIIDGADIDLPGAYSRGVAIKVGLIGDNPNSPTVGSTTISLGAHLKSLMAIEWYDDNGGQLTAPSATTINIKGGKWSAMGTTEWAAGDLEASGTFSGDVRSIKVGRDLTGDWEMNSLGSLSVKNDLYESTLSLLQAPDAKKPALGKLTVKAWIEAASVLSRGNIRAVSCLGMEDSVLFAGVQNISDGNLDGVWDLPDPASDLLLGEGAGRAAIKSVKIKGDREWYASFFNSNIAAAEIGILYVAYAELDNGGEPFGVAADYIKKVTTRDEEGQVTHTNLDSPADSFGDGDADVRLV